METDELLHFRADKDRYFRDGDQSPLPEAGRASFTGLSYFEPNPVFALHAPLEPVEPTEVAIATTTGDERTYLRVATVTFTVDGTEVTAALYSTGHEGLFLPFRDATSGKESYGAGRYVDVHPNGDGTAVIDFNYAYAPFCAYSDRYSCALPPAENWFDVAIRAGEKNPG